MTVSQHDVIDIVAEDRNGALLVMVEERNWGGDGQLLPELQEKLNSYYNYVTNGSLAADYPTLKNKPVRIELRCMNSPTAREIEFLRIVLEQVLKPASIALSWKLITYRLHSE